MVIRLACDLEAELVTLLVTHDVRSGMNATDSRTKREDVPLKILANAARDLSYVSEAEKGDIRQLAELRNRYAHDKQRAQLPDDDAMFSLIQETTLYRDTPELTRFERQQALMAIGCELCARLQDAVAKMGKGEP
jgi:hypothetical protein